MAMRLPTKEASRLKRPREEKPDHLTFIRSLPCAVCYGFKCGPSEAAHVRAENLCYAKRNSGLGAKPDDSWAVPLCHAHHMEQHAGNEMNFWAEYQIDPFILALALWKHTGDLEAALIVLENAR